MKMVKSLLLGTAAGLVAMTGAQAADLPVKAKPVQYVKICSLYGAGFYYIPGTDMCLKIGGWVRAEYGYGMNGGLGGPPVNGNVNNRTTNDSVMRARGYITADARNQSEYGTIRSYIAVGTSGSDTNGSPNFGPSTGAVFDANRAFIQFAGFTFGKTQSFYDFYSFPATGYIPDLYSDTGDAGWHVIGYTAQFGNGFSATIAAEMRRSTQILQGGAAGAVAANTGATAAGTVLGGGSMTALPGYGGFQAPDFVGNLRIDQAWGSAQVMGALHEVNIAYNGSPVAANGFEASGNASTAWGFALGAGIKLNAPSIGPGDYFQAQVNYAQGALRYLWASGDTNPYVQHGQNAAYGVTADAVMGGTAAAGNMTSLQLTSGWGANAAYEHFWNTRWRTSVHGGYTAISYGGLANALICSIEGQAGATFGTGAVATAGCNNNWSEWALGTRTQWNVTPDTYLGLDIAYTRIRSAGSATGFVPFANVPVTTLAGVSATTTETASDQGVWSARFRVHKDFYP